MARAAAAAAALAVLWYVPMQAVPRVRLCGFYWLTGRPCPLCGLTRGLFALAKGHWTEALRFHALTPLALAMLLALLWNGPATRRLWTGGFAAFAVYGVWRILDGAAFH